MVNILKPLSIAPLLKAKDKRPNPFPGRRRGPLGDKL